MLSSEYSFDRTKLDLLEDFVNGQVSLYEQHALLYDGQMELDFQLTDQGIEVNDEFISVIMDGTVHTPFMEIMDIQTAEETEDAHY